MTGKYPFRRAPLVWGNFPKEEESHTFSNLMRNSGYQTGVTGKWQLTLLKDDPKHPHRLGFNHSDLFGWHEGPRYYEPMIYQNGQVRSDTEGHYGPDLYLSSLIEFMKANRDQPFLAYYSMALCHDVTDDLAEPVPHGPFGRYDSYAEMVAEMDRNIGRLVAALNALDLRENTLILFVADNGTPQQMIVRAESNRLIKEPVVSRQHGQDVPGGKATLKDGGTRVPMIANWTGTIIPGQIVDDLVDFTDLLPTFLELGGIAIADNQVLDGKSFANLLLGQGKSQRTWVFAEEFALPKPGGTDPSEEITGRKWLRNERWKLYNDGRMYDMSNDPLEEMPITKESDSEKGRVVRAHFEGVFKDLF
jgi:arylsulfatase A-like enzyme